MRKHVAIVGAGLAGLAAAQALQERCSVTLFDGKGVGGGASGIAAGLVHPYVGRHVRRSKFADEALAFAGSLISRVEGLLGEGLTHQGILRLPVFPWHPKEFQLCASRYPDASLTDEGALWISSGLSVNVKRYLSGLWKLCERGGTQFVHERVDPASLEGQFDLVVLAMGADLPLPLDRTKGQLLKLHWSGKAPRSPALVGRKYLVMEKDGRSCVVGATYERRFSTPLPNEGDALRLILPDLRQIAPHLTPSIIGCAAGIRGHSIGGYLPQIERLSERVYALSGLGSRGLLYHAWLAYRLADRVLL